MKLGLEIRHNLGPSQNRALQQIPIPIETSGIYNILQIETNVIPMVYIFRKPNRPQDPFEYELDAAVVRTLLVAKACPRGWDNELIQVFDEEIEAGPLVLGS